MATSPHILVVDDHQEIRDSLKAYLTSKNYRVTTADGGEQMRQVLKTSSIDLVVLDIMMPKEDGLTLCRYLNEHTRLPVIMLTAVSDDTDRVIGLEMGADDYLTKPFNPRELLARIKAVLRRTQSLPPITNAPMSNIITFSHWQLDVARRELIDGQNVSIPLSTAEYRLLVAFLEHPMIILSRDQIMDLTRGQDANAFDRSIDNQVSRLRKKIELDPKKPTLIKTVWGGGYMLTTKVKHV